MSDKSKIEWTDATWNPASGCTQVSPGCAHCYAKIITERFQGPGSFARVVLHPNRLTAPLHWRAPRRVFVNSMSDLFHEDIPDEFIAQVFGVMVRARRHTFQVLTKRIERAEEWLAAASPADALAELAVAEPAAFDKPFGLDEALSLRWPLPNVLIGPTVENQRFAAIRLPVVRRIHERGWRTMVSYEPALGPIDFAPYLDGIDWLICGGESGARRRKFDPEWARSSYRQAQDAGVAYFMKQMGGARPGTKMEDLPRDLRIRQYPQVAAMR